MFYGAWAYWVNHEFGQSMAYTAALTQGSYSFFMTLSLSIIVEWLYQSLDKFNHHHWLVIALACVLLYFSSWLVNAVAGTPNIFFTILPGAAISTVYTLVYVLTLKKLSKPR